MNATMSATIVDEGTNGGCRTLAAASVGGSELMVDGVRVQRDLEPGRVPKITGQLS
jgi:hypothetical protein